MESDISTVEPGAGSSDASLDFDPGAMRRAGYQVIDWIVSRIENLRASDLERELTREQTESLLREPMPEEPCNLDDVFEAYRTKVAPNSIALDHPRFFAFVPSAPTFVSVLADALAAGTNVFAGTWLESSGPSQVELIVIDWFKQMLGLPQEAAGLLVSGGSIGTLTALAVARRSVLSDETDGACVYLSDQAHASIDRALHLLGIRPGQIRHLPTDGRCKMKTAELARCIQDDYSKGLRPFAVVASAGTTNTGAVDPLSEIAEVARENALWFHVDAAYGGFAALTDRGRRLLAGIDRADSVVLDPHKWFYCAFEAGCVLVRKGHLMRETFRILPEYMLDAARQDREVNFCDYGPQLSRSFRALKIWMTVKTYGARRLRATIDRCLDLAEYAARMFELSPHLALLTRPELGVFTFRYLPEIIPADPERAEQRLARVNERLVARIVSSGRLMLSSTRLDGRYVLRFCVLNHRTRKEDVAEALRLIEEFGKEAEESTEH